MIGFIIGDSGEITTKGKREIFQVIDKNGYISRSELSNKVEKVADALIGTSYKPLTYDDKVELMEMLTVRYTKAILRNYKHNCISNH